MNNNQNSSQDFQNLVEKYLDGKITLDEAKKLVNYYESFQESQEWSNELGSENKIKNEILINILESIQDKQPAKVIPFYKSTFFKYAVAASLVLFLGLGYVFNSQGVGDIESGVVSNLIKIGSDKATLTLEDGTNIELDKDKSFKSDKITSNGKVLKYNNSDEKEEELVYNYLTIPRGGQFFVELSDGTKVWLNSDSKLKYPVNFIEGRSREVELVYGEAYFDVSKSINHNGDGFVLKTIEQNIQVLGTVFNVKAYRDDKEILTTLVEGSVKVSNGVNSTMLKPGEQSKLCQTDNDIDITRVEVEDVVSWRIGEFSFTNMSLEEIIKVLSRWYDIDIVISNESIKKIGFTGIISKQQSVEYILDIIKNTIDMNYEIKENKIIIE
ncbi:MAG: FecR domain-containing protein [Polaribacter sp.]|uniref:FecR family protein n=1 Tax=Polaribacter sp. TaxID=1920175 RepID=UPI003262E34E